MLGHSQRKHTSTGRVLYNFDISNLPRQMLMQLQNKAADAKTGAAATKRQMLATARDSDEAIAKSMARPMCLASVPSIPSSSSSSSSPSSLPLFFYYHHRHHYHYCCAKCAPRVERHTADAKPKEQFNERRHMQCCTSQCFTETQLKIHY